MPVLWPRGIQDVRPDNAGSFEIKLRGNPYSYSHDDEKVAIRNVLLRILDELAREGWSVVPAAGGLRRVGKYSASFERGKYCLQRNKIIIGLLIKHRCYNIPTATTGGTIPAMHFLRLRGPDSSHQCPP